MPGAFWPFDSASLGTLYRRLPFPFFFLFFFFFFSFFFFFFFSFFFDSRLRVTLLIRSHHPLLRGSPIVSSDVKLIDRHFPTSLSFPLLTHLFDGSVAKRPFSQASMPPFSLFGLGGALRPPFVGDDMCYRVRPSRRSRSEVFLVFPNWITLP